ncbi:hypothetical protein [Streptomyces sp. NBC_01439]|nr:hypothetical protein [Streptomyces sp. NBC_01439]
MDANSSQQEIEAALIRAAEELAAASQRLAETIATPSPSGSQQ